MTVQGSNKIFYEAMWFDDKNEETPIIRARSVDGLINLLIDYTKGKSGLIEIYKIEYNNLGHKIGLIQKIQVMDDLNLK